MSASLAQHIAARNDDDLLARLVAAAEIAGIENPQGWAEQNRGKIVAAEVNGSTISEIHAYAVEQVHVPLPAGADPQYITDSMIQAAVNQTHSE